MKLKTEDGTEVVSNNYPLYQIFESRFHPIGLPITESEGKQFELILSTTDKPLQLVSLINNGIVFRTAYFYSKQELIKNPQLLLKLIEGKIFQPFTEPEAFKVGLLIAPFSLLVLFTHFSLSRKKPSSD